MSRFYGEVGFAVTEETKPGVFEAQIVPRNYYGDTISNYKNYNNSNVVNDNVRLNTKFSILADVYAYSNQHNIKYVEYEGTKWRVETVEPQRPRLILTVGGVYNG